MSRAEDLYGEAFRGVAKRAVAAASGSFRLTPVDRRSPARCSYRVRFSLFKFGGGIGMICGAGLEGERDAGIVGQPGVPSIGSAQGLVDQ